MNPAVMLHLFQYLDGEKLLVVNRGAVDGGGYVDDDVASAAGSVRQQVLVVARYPEISVSAQLQRGCGKRPANIYHRVLEDMLQER